jgi:C-terminal processing protease CtpA/Prc
MANIFIDKDQTVVKLEKGEVNTSDALAEPSFTSILTFMSLASLEASFDVLIDSVSSPFSSVRSIVLDLRNNPGGLLDEAVKMANIFIDKDQTVVKLVY